MLQSERLIREPFLELDISFAKSNIAFSFEKFGAQIDIDPVV